MHQSRGPEVELPAPRGVRAYLARIVVTLLAVGLWFWTQSLIGSRALPGSGLGDGMHSLLAPVNLYLHLHPASTDALLIVSSFFIDALAVFLLGSWIFGPSARPLLGLVLVLALRQLMQALVALPAPPGMIWHDPGFPSLLVTYGVANDFFFSGHTAVAVLGALELARRNRRWLTSLAVVIVVFEVLTVLALRAHYTMDIFAGILAALGAARVSEKTSPRLDRWLNRIGGASFGANHGSTL